MNTEVTKPKKKVMKLDSKEAEEFKAFKKKKREQEEKDAKMKAFNDEFTALLEKHNMTPQVINPELFQAIKSLADFVPQLQDVATKMRIGFDIKKEE